MIDLSIANAKIKCKLIRVFVLSTILVRESRNWTQRIVDELLTIEILSDGDNLSPSVFQLYDFVVQLQGVTFCNGFIFYQFLLWGKRKGFVENFEPSTLCRRSRFLFQQSSV